MSCSMKLPIARRSGRSVVDAPATDTANAQLHGRCR
jgi:hypothetical protein